MGTWAARFSWWAGPRHVNNRRIGNLLGQVIMCAASLATFLVNGGMEQNPGPGMEGKNIMQVLCSGCKRILKSGMRCETCDCWYHNSFGNVKAHMVQSGKWNCDKCRYERLQVPEEALCSKLMS